MRSLVALLGLLALLSSAGGCELVADFDRDKIPGDRPAGGGDPDAGSGDPAADDDAGGSGDDAG